MNVPGRCYRKAVAAIALAGLMGFGGLAAEPNAKPAQLQKLGDITDKTLVAWVQLANTTQQAGSVLTLIDDQERFDAVVFAEKTPGKWMAGSDFFKRTQPDRTKYPVETADAKTLVQIAIVYDGKKVTIYRGGRQYATYQIDQPQSFDEDVIVLLRLRYIGHQGEIGPFTCPITCSDTYWGFEKCS